MTDLDLAYLAGFFDGEGSITIHTNGRKSPRGLVPNHTLAVSVGNTEPAVIEWLHQEFGGQLTVRPNSPPLRTVHQWTVRALQAQRFLERIQPFVRMKARQVEVALAYQRTKTMRGPKRVTDETVEWREAQRTELRRLNGRFTTQPTRYMTSGEGEL